MSLDVRPIERRATSAHGRSDDPPHVLGDGQLGDLVAEQGEFRPDAPAAPRWILARHTPDQTANLGVEPRPADRVGPGLPPPVELEALAVPRQNGRGLHDDETGPPTRPDAGQPDPEDPVPSSQPGSADGSLEDEELMAEREVLEGDGRRPEEDSAAGTSTDRSRISWGTPASGMASGPRLYRISVGKGSLGGETDGVFDRDRASY